MRFAPILFLDALPGEALSRAAVDELRAALRQIARNPDARINVALTLDFLEAADRAAYREPVLELRSLAEHGRVEFAATAARRECLPLVPMPERRRLLERGLEGCRARLGDAFAPTTLVPPDLAYDRFTARLAREHSLDAVVLDSSSYVGGVAGGDAPVPTFVVDGIGVRALFAHRALDDAVHSGAAPDLQAVLTMQRGPLAVVVVFEPGEAPAGPRGPAAFLEKALEHGQVETVRLTSLLSSTSAPIPIDPIPSSRRTGRIDLATGAPFSRWDTPRHSIHADLAALRAEIFRCATTAEGAARVAVDDALGSQALASVSCRPDFEPAVALAGIDRIERALRACDALADKRIALLACARERIRRWSERGTAAELTRRFQDAGSDGNPIPEHGIDEGAAA